MAELFVPKVIISASADGLQLTGTDDSNYSTNTQGVTVNNVTSRIVEVQNADGDVLATYDFTASPYTFEQAQSADTVYAFILTFIANAVTYIGEVDYLSTRIYDAAQRDKAADLDCACKSNKLCTNMTKAREFALAAQDAFLLGQNADAQARIDSANLYINLPC